MLQSLRLPIAIHQKHQAEKHHRRIDALSSRFWPDVLRNLTEHTYFATMLKNKKIGHKSRTPFAPRHCFLPGKTICWRSWEAALLKVCKVLHHDSLLLPRDRSASLCRHQKQNSLAIFCFAIMAIRFVLRKIYFIHEISVAPLAYQWSTYDRLVWKSTELFTSDVGACSITAFS